MQGTTLAYTAMVLWGDHPPPQPIIEDDLQDDHEALIGPPVMNTITLTATIGMPFSLNWWFIWILMLCLSERNYPKYLVDLAASIDQPQLPKLIRQFLYQQLNLSDDSDVTSVLLSDCLEFNGHVFVYHSVITQFYALSNLCGVGGIILSMMDSWACVSGGSISSSHLFMRDCTTHVPWCTGLYQSVSQCTTRQGNGWWSWSI